MSDHHHHHDPLDPDDPMSMMGVAMIGMALQEMAEREEHERRASLSPWERAAEDRRYREAAELAWRVVGLIFLGMAVLACLSLVVASLNTALR